MNLLDENIPRLQWEWLRQRGLPVRQIGFEIAYSSIDDDAIIRLLHELKRATLFTQDRERAVVAIGLREGRHLERRSVNALRTCS